MQIDETVIKKENIWLTEKLFDNLIVIVKVKPRNRKFYE